MGRRLAAIWVAIAESFHVNGWREVDPFFLLSISLHVVPIDINSWPSFERSGDDVQLLDALVLENDGQQHVIQVLQGKRLKTQKTNTGTRIGTW
jgi:hypothetical protein